MGREGTEGAPPAEAEATGVAPVGTTTGVETCTCYCLASWGAPVNPANPDVPDPGSPTVSGVLTETETEVGSVFWTANVVEKTYDCQAKTILGTATVVLNLAHDRYRSVRTRSLGLRWRTVTVFGKAFRVPASVGYGPWSAPTRTSTATTEKDALGSSSPPSLPWCPDEGVPCP